MTAARDDQRMSLGEEVDQIAAELAQRHPGWSIAVTVGAIPPGYPSTEETPTRLIMLERSPPLVR